MFNVYLLNFSLIASRCMQSYYLSLWEDKQMPMALQGQPAGRQGQQLHTKLTYASTFTYHTLSRRKTHPDGHIEFRPRKIEPPRDGVAGTCSSCLYVYYIMMALLCLAGRESVLGLFFLFGAAFIFNGRLLVTLCTTSRNSRIHNKILH